MTRLATFAVSLSVLAGLVLTCPTPSASRGPAYRPTSMDLRTKHVAVIGDSYTHGTEDGGRGAGSWTARTWRTLAARGMRIVGDVAAEGRAGYGMIGDHGSVFEDLAGRAVRSDDAVVVFFGSRNDQGVDLKVLAEKARVNFDLARRYAPTARLLVIGPPWPTADVPVPVLQIRDVLYGAAQAVGATWVDPIFERWFVDRPELIAKDGVHPNDAGHKYMADKITPLIRAQLVGW